MSLSRRESRRLVLVASILAMAACDAAPEPASAVPSNYPANFISKGEVQTLAGPTVCSGTGRLERAFKSVGALAIDREGQIHFDVQPTRAHLGLGLIRKVEHGKSTILTTGYPAGKNGSGSTFGRIAPGLNGSVVITLGAQLVEIKSTFLPDGGQPNGFSLQPELLAGDPDASPGIPGEKSMGDGGPSAKARFLKVSSIAADEDGNLYLAEQEAKTGGFRVRFINRSDKAHTFFGQTSREKTVAPGSIDSLIRASRHGRGNSVLKGYAPIMSVREGVLYISSQGRLQEDADSFSRVLAANLTDRSLRVHGTTLNPGQSRLLVGSPRVSQVTGMAADAKGNLFLADRHKSIVFKLDRSGHLNRFAGTGRAGYNGDNRKASTALLNKPSDVGIGPQGQVFISDGSNGLLRQVDAAGTIHKGPGLELMPACSGQKASKPGTPLEPETVDTGGGKVAYFFDRKSKSIMRTSSSVTTKASPFIGRFGRGANQIVALAVHPGGGVYISEHDSAKTYIWFLNDTGTTRKVNGVAVPAGKKRLLAGGTELDADGLFEAGPALKANLAPGAGITPIAADDKGNIFFLERNAGLLMVDGDGMLSRLPTPGVRVFSPPGILDWSQQSSGIATDSAGNVFVSDNLNHKIWVLNRSGAEASFAGQRVAAGAVGVLAGNGLASVSGDGRGLDVSLPWIGGMAVDGAGNIFFAETRSYSVRRIDPTGFLKTVAGTGQEGFNGDGMRAQFTSLTEPEDVAVDRCGNLLIASRKQAQIDGRIRRVNLGGSC